MRRVPLCPSASSWRLLRLLQLRVGQVPSDATPRDRRARGGGGGGGGGAPRRGEAPLDSDGQATRLRRLARMVTARKEGKCVHYHLVGPDIASLWVAMREAAEEHLVELRAAVEGFSAAPNTLEGRSREELIGQAERGEVVLIDVRPRSEFEAAHLPFARSMPLEEVAARIAELSSRHWRLRHSSPRSPLSRGPRPCRA